MNFLAVVSSWRNTIPCWCKYVNTRLCTIQYRYHNLVYFSQIIFSLLCKVYTWQVFLSMVYYGYIEPKNVTTKNWSKKLWKTKEELWVSHFLSWIERKIRRTSRAIAGEGRTKHNLCNPYTLIIKQNPVPRRVQGLGGGPKGSRTPRSSMVRLTVEPSTFGPWVHRTIVYHTNKYEKTLLAQS